MSPLGWPASLASSSEEWPVGSTLRQTVSDPLDTWHIIIFQNVLLLNFPRRLTYYYFLDCVSFKLSKIQICDRQWSRVSTWHLSEWKQKWFNPCLLLHLTRLTYYYFPDCVSFELSKSSSFAGLHSIKKEPTL